jgi:two-component system response regulator HydG
MSGRLRILIVDDERRMAKTLVDILKVKGYKAEAAHSAPEALHMVQKGHFDCVLTDIRMPEMNGVELYQAAKESQPDLPVVLMTAYSSDTLVKVGQEKGAIAVLTKPLDINLLLSFFSSLRKQPSIVIVDDDPQFCKTLGDILRERYFKVAEVIYPHNLLKALGPDSQVVLLDMKLNSISGLDLLKDIKKQSPELPVILVAGYREEMAPSIEAALKIGAYTCLYKPFQIDKLLQLLSHIHRQELGRLLGRPFGKEMGCQQ